MGIYAKNRWEWSTTQQALWAYSCATVPLYDTLGTDALAFIAQQAGLTTIFCSKLETPKLLAAKTAKATELAALKNVVQFEDVDEAGRKAAAEVGLNLLSFAQVSDAGKFNHRDAIKPNPDDIAVICYTCVCCGSGGGCLACREATPPPSLRLAGRARRATPRAPS